MKRAALLVTALLLAWPVCAQEETVQPAEAIQSLQDFIHENLDEDALDAMGFDVPRVYQFLNDLQSRFQGTNVYALESLHEAATNILPVLESFEETQPYVDWLKSRLDYFDTLDDLQRESGITNRPRGQLPTPAPEVERKVWQRVVEKRPIPPRATKLVPVLKPIFIEERVPPELVWLAEVESSFNPKARSPAGAAGLFQLMPATAKSLDLSLWPRDERLQPEKNARAAASYLRYLNSRFGDWPLALAAYNAGEGRVSRLLNNRKERSFDAIANALPAETQMYVPKVEATILRREGRTLAELKLPK
jgi:membrane-bound lytic murein transglycosylase D